MSLAEQIYIIDDDAVASTYIDGIMKSGGYQCVAFDSADSFLFHAKPELRGCIVLDLQMEGMNGLELQAELLKRCILMPVIIVSGQAVVASAVQAMKQQAFDLFEKPVNPQALLAAIARALAYDAQHAVARHESHLVKDLYSTLSPRERQVMGLVVQGLANKQVASKLALSEKTIEVHRGNVMRKMKVDSLAALVRAAMHCEPPASLVESA